MSRSMGGYWNHLPVQDDYANIANESRDVAQPGSALEWGSSGRRFKSAHPDQPFSYKINPPNFG